MKYVLSLLSAFFLCGPLAAQLYNAGSIVEISAGAILYSAGDVANSSGGALGNQGTLITAENLINQHEALIYGNGQYMLGRNWHNSAEFDAGSSTVTFTGPLASTITSGDANFFTVHLAKSGADLVLLDDLEILDTLAFLSTHNPVVLMDQNLTFGVNGGMLNFDENNHFITTGTGKVIKAGLGAAPFTFPVGYTGYNPVTIAQNGTVDQIGIRCLPTLLTSGVSGMPITMDAVDVAWEISEAIPGENDFDLTVFWNSDQEVFFDRNNCALGLWDGTSWDFDQLPRSAAGTAGTLFAQSRQSLTEAGIIGLRSGSELVDAHDLPTEQWKPLAYPNPFSGRVYVRSAGEQIRLFDLAGHLLLQDKPAYGERVLDLQHLPAGTYILQATSLDKGAVNVKLVKTN